MDNWKNPTYCCIIIRNILSPAPRGKVDNGCFRYLKLILGEAGDNYKNVLSYDLFVKIVRMKICRCTNTRNILLATTSNYGHDEMYSKFNHRPRNTNKRKKKFKRLKITKINSSAYI